MKVFNSNKSKYTTTQLFIAVTMTGAVIQLPACGGGSEGTPLNPAPAPAPAPVIPALKINPSTLRSVQGQSTALAISGGVAPYRAYSSDAAALAVPAEVIGTTVLLTPTNVAADTAVTITIVDAAGTTVSATVTVVPSTLFSGLSITSATSVGTAGCSPAVCSGQMALAQVNVKNATGAPIAGRLIRFEVVQGQFSFALNDNASQTARSVTVVADINGTAAVRVIADVTATTGVALISATDVTTGGQINQSFSIAQATDGTGILSITPSKWTLVGPYKGACTTDAEVGYYIFGGTPPYRVVSPVPANILVGNLFNGSVTAMTTVASNGGYFIARTIAGCVSNGAGILAVTDALGRTVSVAIENTEGSAPAPTPAPVATLTISPPDISLLASHGICSSTAYKLDLQGGSAPYRAAASVLGVAINNLQGTQTVGNSFSVNIPSAGILAGSDMKVSVVDANSATVSSTFHCIAPPTAAPTPAPSIRPLVISPGASRIEVNAAGRCVGQTVPMLISGGQSPYTVSSSVASTVLNGVTGVTSTSGNLTLTLPATGIAGGTSLLVSAVDALGNAISASVACDNTAAGVGALNLLVPTIILTASTGSNYCTTVVGTPARFVLSGGQSPFNATPLANYSDVSTALSGVNFDINIAANSLALAKLGNLRYRISDALGQSVIAVLDCQ